MKVSVIIATYNRSEMLVDLVERIRKQTVKAEIVVADDGTRNRVVCGDRYLWRQDDGYHKVWMVNRAVQVASGDVLVFVDDDTRPRNNRWLRAHLKALEKGKASRGPFYLGRLEKGVFRQTSPHIFGLSGCYWATTNTAMYRTVWDSIGGYDERFDGWYGFEDVDFGIRLKNARVRVVKPTADATAEHIGKPHCGEGAGLDAQQMNRNRLILEEKWGEPVEALMAKSG